MNFCSILVIAEDSVIHNIGYGVNSFTRLLSFNQFSEEELENFDAFLLINSNGLEKEFIGNLFSIGDEPSEELKSLLATFNKKSIPTIYWELSKLSNIDCITNYFSKIYTSFIEERIEEGEFNNLVSYLPQFFNPRFYNPYEFTVDKSTDNYKQSAISKEALEHFSAGELIDNTVEFPFSEYLNCIDKKAFWKGYCSFVLLSSELQNQNIESFCLEATACGVPVIILQVCDYVSLLQYAVLSSQNKNAVLGYIKRSADNCERLKKECHIRWRHVNLHHTNKNRISVISKNIIAYKELPLLPRVTVFIPTNRKHLLESCHEQFENQNYPNIELIIAYNENDLDKDVVESFNSKNKKLIVVPKEKNVGSAMNAAISLATGELCIKMDDDDFYGPNYVLDMVLGQLATDADIFGKPPKYIYFEELDETYCRECSHENTLIEVEKFVTHQFRISGATHSGKTSFLKKNNFCELNRGAVDTATFEQMAGKKFKVAALDAYSTIVFRSKNINMHTWQISTEKLTQKASKVGNGLTKEKILF